jgi:hypothetical protein
MSFQNHYFAVRVYIEVIHQNFWIILIAPLVYQDLLSEHTQTID